MNIISGEKQLYNTVSNIAKYGKSKLIDNETPINDSRESNRNNFNTTMNIVGGANRRTSMARTIQTKNIGIFEGNDILDEIPDLSDFRDVGKRNKNRFMSIPGQSSGRNKKGSQTSVPEHVRKHSLLIK